MPARVAAAVSISRACIQVFALSFFFFGVATNGERVRQSSTEKNLRRVGLDSAILDISLFFGPNNEGGGREDYAGKIQGDTGQQCQSVSAVHATVAATW